MGQTKTFMTAEQLLEIAGRGRSELVRGELVKMCAVGRPHSRIVLRLGRWMGAFVEERRLGEVGTEGGFTLSRDPDTVRAPDIHFVSAARLGPPDEQGFFEGAPDLVVEVLSPEDRASEVQEKVREYLAAGARLVLVVDPRNETVTAHHPSGAAQVYSGQQEVSGEDVLPGFSFRPADLFRLD